MSKRTGQNSPLGTAQSSKMRQGSVVATERKAINLNEDYGDGNEKQRSELKIKNENSKNSELEAEKHNFLRADSPNF